MHTCTMYVHFVCVYACTCTVDIRCRYRPLHVFTVQCVFSLSQGVPELVTDSSDDCTYTFTWRSALACPVDIYSTNFSSNICSYRDPDINALFTYQAIASKHVSIPDSDTKYHVQLCGSMTEAPKECGSDVGICRTVGKDTKTLVHANHKFVITSHSPHIFEVVYDSGETCNGEKQWTAVVTLACKWRGGTSDPVFLSADDCNLRFIWRSSLFCVGPEMCAAKDEASGYTYDLDGLLDDTWSVRWLDRACTCTLYMHIYMYMCIAH